MTNKSVHEFTKLDEAYKVLDKFIFGEEEESLLDQLDNAFYRTVDGDSENYDRFNELIESAKTMIEEAMTQAIKTANRKIKEVA